MDWKLALAELLVCGVVGLTGMGGGALMTPVLVRFFHIQPLAAVSSDLVASAFMKPVGGFVHLRGGLPGVRRPSAHRTGPFGMTASAHRGTARRAKLTDFFLP